jgi:hypothetical protein
VRRGPNRGWRVALGLALGVLVAGCADEIPLGAPSWGAGALGVGLPGWSRVRGRIENGVLRLELPRVQATVIYTMQADGTLVAEYWRGDQITSRGRLARAPRERT